MMPGAKHTLSPTFSDRFFLRHLPSRQDTELVQYLQQDWLQQCTGSRTLLQEAALGFHPAAFCFPEVL